jgi:AcrR family transcriptional regulator
MGFRLRKHIRTTVRIFNGIQGDWQGLFSSQSIRRDWGMGKGEATRGRILDEAMRIASREGLEGLTIGSLAKALELSKSGLFMHFGSKEALQLAVLEHTFERFRQFLGPRMEGVQDPVERLRHLFSGWLDWIDNPELPGGCPVLGAAFELDDREGVPREILVARQRITQQNLAAAFQAVLPAGADPGQFVFELRALTLAYHYMSRFMRDPQARERAERAFEGLLARALSAPVGSPAGPPPSRS